MTLPPISPSGVSTAFQYGTQTSQGGGFTAALAAVPPSVNAPLIFEPGYLLTSNRLQVWMVVTAPQPNWGGAQIWVSADGSTYGQLGVVIAGGVQGVLTATFPSGADPDTMDSIQVDVSECSESIVAGSTQDADLGITLCYVGGELVGYSASALMSPNNYTLGSYLRRGMFGSTNASHAIGSTFALLDGHVFAQTYPSIMVGSTIYFKFPSFNDLGAQVQDLSTVTAYPYTLTGAGVNPAGAGSGVCAVDLALAAGCSEDWGFLENVVSTTCDWGTLSSIVPLSVDLGVLGL